MKWVNEVKHDSLGIAAGVRHVERRTLAGTDNEDIKRKQNAPHEEDGIKAWNRLLSWYMGTLSLCIVETLMKLCQPDRHQKPESNHVCWTVGWQRS